MVSVPSTQPAVRDEFRREALELLRARRTPREPAESLACRSRRSGTGVAGTQLDRHGGLVQSRLVGPPTRDVGSASDSRTRLTGVV